MFVRAFVSFVLLFLLSACSDKNAHIKTVLQGKTMGTKYHVSIVHPVSKPLDQSILQRDIDQLLLKLNQQVSTYIPNSEISQFNQLQSTDAFPISDDFLRIVLASQKVSEQTQGYFDVTISPLINLWGFGSKQKMESPSKEQLQEVRNSVGFEYLNVNNTLRSLGKKKESLEIDLSAIAKGFGVDKLSEFLIDQGFNNHLVEIGGEVRANGKNHLDKPWRIAIESPDITEGTIDKSLSLSNQAVATSGDYRNYFVENGVRRSHIIDPKTTYPITHKLASVTVLHRSAMFADAYATALMVMGEERGKVFVKAQGLDVIMVIREKGTFRIWSSY